MSTPTPKPRAIASVRKEWERLLKSLKGDIDDDYRASEDDDKPGMQVTFGLTQNEDGSLSWSYQTGDNSYSGGAYSHPVWAVVSLYRRSNCKELAAEAMDQALDQL
jgi:outer membrane protein assembly factor BamA